MNTGLRLALAHHLGPVLLQVLGRSLRLEERGVEVVEALHRGGEPVIYALWHGEMLMLAYAKRGRGIRVLVSAHRDGEIIRRVIEPLGFEAVRGSSTRGGARALRALLARAGEGNDVAITPDGPRGPREIVKPGILFLARASGRAIIPLAARAIPSWTLSTWDGFRIPRPFARALILHGEPLRLPPRAADAEIGKYQEELRWRLCDLGAQADRSLGAGAH